MTDHPEQARYHLMQAEAVMKPGFPITVLQHHLVKAQFHLLSAQLEAFDPQPDQRAELDKVNAVLRKRGFDYPVGAAGVESALSFVMAHLDAIEERVKVALALHVTVGGDNPVCLECDGEPHPCPTRRALTEDAT